MLYITGNYSILNHNGKEYEREHMCVCVCVCVCVYVYTYLNHFAILRN